MPDLVNSRERMLYAFVVIVSLVTYGLIGLVVLAQPEFAISVAFYGVLFAVAAFFAQGHAIGRLRGNAIRAGERQFPLLHRTVQEHARRLGLVRTPEVYVVESSGLLNAFATRFLGRDFVVIHSDVLELAMAEGEPAVSFILAHELGHVWRGHLKRRWLTAPGRFTPYLGAAYSRACEYTCDRVGAYCRPDGAIQGLLVLAAGKQLHQLVDARELAAQAEAERGFWVRRGELGSSHPYLPKRVAALLREGAPLPVSTRATSPRAA